MKYEATSVATSSLCRAAADSPKYPLPSVHGMVLYWLHAWSRIFTRVWKAPQWWRRRETDYPRNARLLPSELLPSRGH